MYGCESWTLKKTEHRRIDAFQLCWRKLLSVPWPARRSNQSIWKEINPEYSLERLMLKLQYLGHLIRRGDSLKMALILGKIEGREESGRDGWMASLIPWTWVWANSRRWWRTGKPGVLQSMGMQIVRHNSVTEHQRSQWGCDVWALACKWRKWSLENIWGRQFGVTKPFF